MDPAKACSETPEPVSTLDPNRKAYDFVSLCWDMARKAGITTGENHWTLLKQRLESKDSLGLRDCEILALQNCDEIPNHMRLINDSVEPYEDGKGSYVLSQSPDISLEFKPYVGPYLKVLSKTEVILDRNVRQVKEYMWKLSTKTYYVYHFLDKVNSINIAIASCYRCDEVIVIKESSLFNIPIIGLRIGDRYIFNIHGNIINVLLHEIIRDIETLLSPILENSQLSASFLMLGTDPCSNCTNDMFLHKVFKYIKQVSFQKVHASEDNQAFAAVGDKNVPIVKYLRFRNVVIDGVHYKPILFYF